MGIIDNSYGFENFKYDGVMSLGYNKNNNELINSLYKQKLIDKKLFAIVIPP